MKNKILTLIVVFSFISLINNQQLYAQTFSSNITDQWIHLVSYKGFESKNLYNFSFQISGNNFNYPDWSLAVRLAEPMINAEGKTLDPSKVSVRFNKFASTGVPKTISGMGAERGAIPLSTEDRYIIRKSNEPLLHGQNNYYSQYTFYFDIIIEGGSYLEELLSNPPITNNDFQYPFKLIFSVLDKNDNLLTQSSSSNQIKINPSDAPPKPTYNIQVNSAARNGLLELKTMRDYVEGVSQTYTDGLSVTSSTTGYAIQVLSLKTNFEAGSNSLPVSAVSLELKDRKNNQSGTIALSDAQQTVFSASSATGKNARLFDIRYFTKPNDERLINAKPASYQTTLMYTLVPQ